MRRVFSLACVAVAMFGLCLVTAARAADPKYTIKAVMGEHKPGKLKEKLTKGTATADEKKMLLEMYEAMAMNKPPKGDADNWKKLNDELIAATKDVIGEKEGAMDRYKKAVDCGVCHGKHK